MRRDAWVRITGFSLVANLVLWGTSGCFEGGNTGAAIVSPSHYIQKDRLHKDGRPGQTSPGPASLTTHYNPHDVMDPPTRIRGWSPNGQSLPLRSGYPRNIYPDAVGWLAEYVQGVHTEACVLHGDQAIIAVLTNGPRTASNEAWMLSEIRYIVMKRVPEIKAVHISTDYPHYKTVSEIATQIRRGVPVAKFRTQIERLLRGIPSARFVR